MGQTGWTYMVYPRDQRQSVIVAGMVGDVDTAKFIAGGVMELDQSALYAVVEHTVCDECPSCSQPDVTTRLMIGTRLIARRNVDGELKWKDTTEPLRVAREAAASLDSLVFGPFGARTPS